MKITKEEIQAEIYKRSFYDFLLDAFKALHNGNELETNWHIKYLCNLLQEQAYKIVNKEDIEKHLLINVPPRTLKSELVNIIFSAYCWILDDSIQIISSSYSASLSISMNTQARRILDSDWFILHFPDIVRSKDENTKATFTNTNGGLRYSTSTGGTVTGKGGDIIIIDDPQNPSLARSEVERDNVNNFFNETLRSRLNNPSKGIFIVIMQRLHENDLTGMLLKLEPEKWNHICLPAEESENVKPKELRKFYIDGLLSPKRLSKVVLSSFKKGLGSYGYSGQYEQLPAPAEGGIIKRNWFNTVESLPDNIVWNFFFDTAYTSKTSNDPSAMICCSYHDNFLWVKEVRTVHLEFPDLIKEIKSFCYSNGYNSSSLAFVEPKASGKSIVQYIRVNTDLNIIESKTPTTDKVSRVNAVSSFLESKRVNLLNRSWNDGFLNECASFPNGLHDDQVDVLTMAIDELTTNTGAFFG